MSATDTITGFCPATRHLAAMDVDWARLIETVGPCRLTPEDAREPYEALVRSIAHQQIHGRAAEAILGRLKALFPGTTFPSPEALLALDPAQLRACGFSLSKLTAIRQVAEKTLDGTVPTRQEAEGLSDEALITRLVTLKGIGRWTVEMLLIFCLERPDVLPVDDFGVREGWKVLKGLPKQPTPGELRQLGQPWAPYRSTAAWYLWQAANRAKLSKG